MKILVVGSRIPWPLRDGGAIATFTMLKYLAKEHEVHYFSFNTKKHFNSPDHIKDFQVATGIKEIETFYLDASINPLSALLNLFFSSSSYHLHRFNIHDAALKLEQYAHQYSFDLMHVESLFSAPITKNIKHIPRILRQHNIEHAIWEKLSIQEKGWKNWYLKLMAKRLKKEEAFWLKHFQFIAAITENDAKKMQQWLPELTISVVPASIPFEQQPPSHQQPAIHEVFHIGSMEWLPNQQGVQWLVQQVWPLVLKSLPEAKLHLAGKGLQKDDPLYAAKGVIVHGEVEDSAQFMLAYQIMAVPLFSGSGLRMKTIEAMSLGKSVVSTQIGADGLEAIPDTHLSIANTIESFAQALILHLTQRETSLTMGLKAKEFVLATYNPDAISKQLTHFYQQVIHSFSKES